LGQNATQATATRAVLQDQVMGNSKSRFDFNRDGIT